MIIYIDAQNGVHATQTPGSVPVETSVFDGMPEAAMECYRYFPGNQTRKEFAQATVKGIQIGRLQTQADFLELESQNTELVESMAAMVEDVYTKDLAAIEEG